MSYYLSNNNKTLELSASDKDYSIEISKNDLEQLFTHYKVGVSFDEIYTSLVHNNLAKFSYDNVNYIVTWLS